MKKTVIFKGGLGNQIYQYGIYSYLKNVLHEDVCYLYRESAHNGFELDKYFKADLKKANVLYRYLYWIVWRLHKYGIYQHFIQTDEGRTAKHPLFYNGYWANKKYFLHQGFDLAFKDLPMSDDNKRIATQIIQPGSIAVHVRRGDYLLPGNRKIFNILDADYYHQAIAYCRQHLSACPRLFFFSDDIEWIKNHIVTDYASTYVSWNKGDNSIYDIYLMSMASANIIANSSFSFWAARLNQNNPVVIYPRKWYADDKKRDIFPDHWISM